MKYDDQMTLFCTEICKNSQNCSVFKIRIIGVTVKHYCGLLKSR